ncbi:cilia- and flagella-associated protein 43 isoform A [Alligator mississippiensis]|uniref:Cilia- and flagella-associated protein 43 n=1 Tax=Alligator mississippiensis TaxID=8496 RepID=A0A151NV44_ALLMI|nr:cilia- and flagella-associated protein 43 isoform A [Alligator mississippiensis]
MEPSGADEADRLLTAAAARVEVRWVQGFPSRNVGFVNHETICYPCGNYILFVDLETKKKTVLPCPSGRVGAFAVNGASGVVAFSDQKLNPVIYIYTFPGLINWRELKGQAQLDYTLLAFSYMGPYLASYSSVPEFALSVWNWQENVLLCSKSQLGMTATSLSFNPLSWHQLCMSSESSITIWNIERSDEEHHLKPKPVQLPAEDASQIFNQNPFFSHPDTQDAYYGPVLPNSAIAGLIRDEALLFRPKDDIQPSVHPTVHCWSATSDLYVGCEEGCILVINSETLETSLLHQKFPTERRQTIVQISPMISEASLKKEGQEEGLAQSVVLAMAFHKNGLYAAGSDGVVHMCQPKDSFYTMKNYLDVSEPITSLVFSPDYSRLLVETEKVREEAVKLLDASSSHFLSADFLTPGNKYCVSVAISGEVHFWLLEDGTCISKLSLNKQATALVCCPSSHTVAVGTKTGHVHFIDATKVNTPRVVHRVLLTHFPVLCLNYDEGGQYLIAGAAEGHIFILDARPSKLFQVLGYLVLSSEVLGLSTVYDKDTELVEVMALLCPADIRRARLEIFCLPSTLTIDNDECVDERGLLKENIIQKQQYELDYPLSSAVRQKDGTIYGYCSHAPFICKYNLASKKILKDPTVVFSEERIQSNQSGRGFLSLSPNNRWLASVAEDGVLFIRDAATLETFAQAHCHSYQGGGIRSLAFSKDGQSMLINGVEDGALVCLKWKMAGDDDIKEADEYWQSTLAVLNNSIYSENNVLKSMRDWHVASKSILPSSSEKGHKEKLQRQPSVELTDEDESFINSVSIGEMTWMKQKIQKAIEEETKKFADKKKELKKGIKSLRKTIQEMMHENEQVPEIEKLDQQEFNLDAEEQERLQLESEQEVARVRKEIEMENLANCYLRDVLKQQCWDSMSVKGRAIKCFHAAYEVKNYPMKERGKEELETLEKVLQLKKIECADLKIRKEIIEFQLPTVSSKEEGEKVEEDVVADETTPIALIGSLSSQYGGDTAVLYPQMDLHTREQKINQIILLQDIIYRVKTAFNKAFDIVARQKEQEIARVKERNLRIQEILTQLDLQEEVWEPTLTDDEIPERVLTVQDSEIKVEKYLTPQQRAKAEMMAKLEMQRRLAAQDNARQRALNDMMDGVLEVKKEDILKMEIPPPPFISKPDTLWSEEEKKIFKEYEKKVKELNEERDKHRKILETELKKLQTAIQETTQSFDDTVCKLFEKKVKSEMVICQEELKINSLLYSLLLDEELSTREAGLHYFLEKKRKEKLSTAEAVQIARRQVDAYRETYDNLVAEDKILERGFRKEFSDVPMHLIDQLFKLYKRRPRAQKMKMHLDTANPYGDRPGSAKAYKDALDHLMRAMNELDNPENMPEGLDLPVWERFCSARRTKVESEQLVKRKALTLAEMQAFLQRRIEDDEKIKKDIDNIFSEVNLLQEQKMRFQLDLTVQFLLKQGQVELESSELIPDYTDAILINKSVIEELNCTIRAQGEKKIASMVECKDFSKGIFQLEWEHKKMKMQMEDLNQKARDIQTLRVSKDRQLFLNVLNYDSRVNHQVSVLEQTLGVMDKLHKEKVKKCQKIIKDLEKRISLKEQANYKLSLELQEMLVSVSERRHIFEAADTQPASEKIAKEHYQDIVQRRRLVDLAKGQAQEIAILQAEVARLRMKTFPALYEVEY